MWLSGTMLHVLCYQRKLKGDREFLEHSFGIDRAMKDMLNFMIKIERITLTECPVGGLHNWKRICLKAESVLAKTCRAENVFFFSGLSALIMGDGKNTLHEYGLETLWYGLWAVEAWAPSILASFKSGSMWQFHH
jgi:hypothetical protein